MSSKVFHSGELAVQQMTGEGYQAQMVGRMIQSEMIPGGAQFIQKQSLVFISSRDAQGQIWVAPLWGNPGFAQSPTPNSVTVDLSTTQNDTKMSLGSHLDNQTAVGLLFIDLNTRRRMRVNGPAHLEGDLLTVSIEEAYPNCPKYIQRRTQTLNASSNNPVGSASSHGYGLLQEHYDWITQADTFFVGSGRDRLDVSHRGGPKGFINKLPNGLLRIPDYQGNSLYNTLGNIAQSPEAGLLFIDFEQGHTLQISGTATLDFDHHEENDLVATTGTGRYWLFEPSQWVATHAQIPAYWVHQDDSPFNPTIT